MLDNQLHVRNNKDTVRSRSKEQGVQVTAKVTSKGQVTIPKEIRRVLRIAEGDTVIFEVDENGVHLCSNRPTSVFAEYAGIWREGEGKTLDEINAELRELRGH